MTIKYIMSCLNSMCADLNDMHNDYDIPTGCEDSLRAMLEEAIEDFNKAQLIWKAMLIPTRNGWKIKYV